MGRLMSAHRRSICTRFISFAVSIAKRCIACCPRRRSVEDWLLRVLLISVSIALSGDFDVAFLSLDGLGLFIEKLDFDDLTEAIWSKVGSLLNCLLSGVNDRHCLPSLDSLGEFSSKKWTLLSRGPRGGFRGAQCPAKCDGQANTVTLIETTRGDPFGGFTRVARFKQRSQAGKQREELPLHAEESARDQRAHIGRGATSEGDYLCFFIWE
jgi:hypothetical protein